MVHFLRWSGEIAEDDSAVAGHGGLSPCDVTSD
jgi:hypothetical protein